MLARHGSLVLILPLLGGCLPPVELNPSFEWLVEQGTMAVPDPDFGSSLAPLGDLDGDGTPDLAIGNGTQLEIFFLRPDGSVKASAESPLNSLKLAFLGDMDGDGFVELGAIDPRQGPRTRILELRSDGTAKDDPWSLPIDFGGQREDGDGFPGSLARIADLDGVVGLPDVDRLLAGLFLDTGPQVGGECIEIPGCPEACPR